MSKEANRAANESGRKGPRLDLRLCAVATELAAIADSQERLPYEIVQFALSHHGFVQPSPVVIVASVAVDDRTALSKVMARKVAAVSAEKEYDYVGVGVSAKGNGEFNGVALLLDSLIDLKPIPRTLGRGKRYKIEGRILPPFVDPQVVVIRADGRMYRWSPQMAPSGRFRLSDRCGEGERRTEILATSSEGPRVLANFVVYCGVKPPKQIALPAKKEASAEGTIDSHVALIEARLLDLVNRERGQANLPPVAPHPQVAVVARKHSREMARTGNLAHVMPTTGTVVDRLLAEGIRMPAVAENLARVGSAREAHRGLMTSPAHRANILWPQATHLGVGVVVVGRGRGATELFVTQVFVQVPVLSDIKAARKQVAGHVARELGIPEDPVLTSVAQSHATALAKGLSPQDAFNRSLIALEGRGHGSSVRIVVSALGDLNDLRVEEIKGVDGSIGRFGAGVALGPHPTLGEQAIYVVLVLGGARL